MTELSREELLRLVARIREDTALERHITDSTLALYATGRLASPERTMVDEHLATCATCSGNAQRLTEAVEDWRSPSGSARLHRRLVVGQSPTVNARPTWRLQWQSVRLAGAALLVVAVLVSIRFIWPPTPELESAKTRSRGDDRISEGILGIGEARAATVDLANAPLSTVGQLDAPSAVYFDDLAVYDGDRKVWGEDFEAALEGSYPPAPMRSVYPFPDGQDADGEQPRGSVTSGLAPGAGRCFESLSLPRRARIDGIDLDRNAVQSGVIRYQASMCLSATDARGALVGLKQEAGEQGRWYDKASVLFVGGTIRTWPGGVVIGQYEPQRWYRVAVTVYFASHDMTVELDGHEVISHTPMGAAEGILRERPTWTPENAWEGFDEFAFGGIFYAPPEAGDDVALMPQETGPNWQTYVVTGDRPGWQPTGLFLKAGDRVEITATGEMLNALPGPSKTDPDGCYLLAADPRASRGLAERGVVVPVPTAWIGSLVARVGQEDGVFVGKHGVVTAIRGGILAFAYNDSYFRDNRGSFTVKVAR